MNENELTVIVPHFESHGKIRHLLESIEQDKNSDLINIFIVDDKSCSEEFELLVTITSLFPQLNISIFMNESLEKGAGAARNIGLSNCTTKWVTFVDADDVFLPGFYKSFSKYFSSNVDIVFFPPTSSNDDGEKLSRHNTYLKFFYEYWDSNSDESLRYKYSTVWSRLYSMDLIKRNNIYFENILSSNDAMFALKSGIYAQNICVSKDVIYCWIYNSQSITTLRSKESFHSSIQLAFRKNKLMKDNLDSKLYSRNRPTMIFYIASSLIRYKYGISFTISIFLELLKGGILPFRFNDLNKIKNFYLNNKNY